MAKVISADIGLAPVNITATAIAGGDLPVGTTYYYKVVAVGPGNSYYQGDGAQWWRSVPSIEVSATTDTTNRTIRIEWDKASDSKVWLLFRTTIVGDYSIYDRITKAWRRNLLVIGSGARSYGAISTELGDGGTTWYKDDAGQHYTRSQPLLPTGVPRLTISGGTEADPIIPDDLADWMLGNGYADNVHNLDFYPDMGHRVVVQLQCTFQNSGETWFSVPSGQHFIQVWGKTCFDANGHINMGDDTTGQPGGGAIWQSYVGYAWYSRTVGQWKVVDSLISAMPHRLYQEIYMNTGGGTCGSMWHLYQPPGVECSIIGTNYNPGEVGSKGRVTGQDLLARHKWKDVGLLTGRKGDLRDLRLHYENVRCKTVGHMIPE